MKLGSSMEVARLLWNSIWRDLSLQQQTVSTSSERLKDPAEIQKAW